MVRTGPDASPEQIQECRRAGDLSAPDKGGITDDIHLFSGSPYERRDETAIT